MSKTHPFFVFGSCRPAVIRARSLGRVCVIHGAPQRMNELGLHIDVCDSPPRVTGGGWVHCGTKNKPWQASLRWSYAVTCQRWLRDRPLQQRYANDLCMPTCNFPSLDPGSFLVDTCDDWHLDQAKRFGLRYLPMPSREPFIGRVSVMTHTCPSQHILPRAARVHRTYPQRTQLIDSPSFTHSPHTLVVS